MFCYRSLKMNSARRVGDIFKEAGKAYSELGDKVMLLHPTAQELHQIEANQQKQQQQQVRKYDLIIEQN